MLTILCRLVCITYTRIYFIIYRAWVRLIELGSWITYQLKQAYHQYLPGFVNYKKGCTGLAAASDKVYQLLAHGWWFSPGTPASSTAKTGCRDIAEILLKLVLNTINQIKALYYYITKVMMTVYGRLFHQYFVFLLVSLSLGNTILCTK